MAGRAGRREVHALIHPFALATFKRYPAPPRCKFIQASRLFVRDRQPQINFTRLLVGCMLPARLMPTRLLAQDFMYGLVMLLWSRNNDITMCTKPKFVRGNIEGGRVMIDAGMGW